MSNNAAACYQHDGVSIALGEEADRDTVVEGLKAAVKFAGEEMGITALLAEDKIGEPEPERELVAAS